MRHLRPNPVKAALRAGRLVIGTFVRTTSLPVVEVLGLAGFDFVVIDNEHSPLDIEATANLIRAAELTGMVPVVRVLENQPSLILRVMDAGAMGVQVPQVGTRAEAERLVRSVKYYPDGDRGLALSHRAARYGMASGSEFIRWTNEESLVVAYVENQAALDNLEEIVAVPGIDVLFVGPFDLSQALGVPGEITNPRIESAIDRVIRTAAAAGVATGIIAADPAAARRWIERGIRYIAYSSDLGLLAGAAGAALAAIRQPQ